MAYTRPTELSFWRACYLCLLCVFRPSCLQRKQDKDNAEREKVAQTADRAQPASTVCRAFWLSFLLVVASVAIGFGVGYVFALWHPSGNARLAGGLQVAGAFLLLWGTLFVRGWEIQTFCGVTLVERVNQWLYRALYCIGTTLIVFSLSLC